MLTPLRRELAAMQARVEALMAGRSPSPLTREGRRRERLPAWEAEAEAAWQAFLDRLRAVRVLDPACGSGNFLYVTLRLLKNLEFEAIRWGGERLGVTGEFPRVGPANVMGIEINPYAKELAGVSIWVGMFQWMIEHGYGFPSENPVLEPLDSIDLRDAILARDESGCAGGGVVASGRVHRREPAVPGAAKLHAAIRLGDELRRRCCLRRGSDSSGAKGADLACYWHEQARRNRSPTEASEPRRPARDELHPTIGAGRQTLLDRIKETRRHFHGLVGPGADPEERQSWQGAGRCGGPRLDRRTRRAARICERCT